MYTVVWIARYRPDLTKAEASEYWATLHGPPMKEVSPVAGYVQSHVQPRAPEHAEALTSPRGRSAMRGFARVS